MASTTQDDENLLLLSAAAAAVIVIRRRRRRRAKRQRHLWCKPWLLERDGERGMSHFVSYELTDNVSFQGFLRMPSDVFEMLLRMVAPDIQKTDAKTRKATPKMVG